MAPLQKRLVDEAAAWGAELLLPLHQPLVYTSAVHFIYHLSTILDHLSKDTVHQGNKNTRGSRMTAMVLVVYNTTIEIVYHNNN